MPTSAPVPPNGDRTDASSAAHAGGRVALDAKLRGPHHTRSSHVLHELGRWSSHAAAGVTVAFLVAGWAIVGIVTGFPSWWQVTLYSTTSAVTVIMVFAIQHTQRREQLVTQRKLDELVQAQPGADNRVIAAEGASDAELDELLEADNT